MKNKIIIIFVAAIVFVVAIFYIIMKLTSGIVDSADEFFNEIKNHNHKAAYEMTSIEFQTTTNFDEFEDFLSHSNIVNYKSSSWSARSVENSIGRLEGSILTEEKGEIPIKLTFVKENDRWKILSINKEFAGIIKTDKKISKEIPPDSILIRLSNQSIIELGKSINKRDFEDFYLSIAKFWQLRTNKEELMKAFQSFIDNNINLVGISGVDPVISEKPSFNKDDFLLISGYYPTEPAMVYFHLKFTYEHPEWKLVGIKVNLKDN